MYGGGTSGGGSTPSAIGIGGRHTKRPCVELLHLGNRRRGSRGRPTVLMATAFARPPSAGDPTAQRRTARATDPVFGALGGGGEFGECVAYVG